MDELLELCAQTSHWLAQRPSEEPISRRLQQEDDLRERARQIDEQLHAWAHVYAPPARHITPPQILSAVTWNLERGKNFESLTQSLQNHPSLANADLYFFTEVDWGMARTGNRNVAAELGKLLNCHSYFAPSYYNFTKGHGSERHLPGTNSLGLHGKAILSRYPLQNLRVVSLPNATNKLRSKEARLGEKRALIGELAMQGRRLQVSCVHLDAFSSPADRVRQLRPAALACAEQNHALIAGDWNTNTLDSRKGSTVLFSVIRQLISPGPSRLIREHHSYPEQRFDRGLFEMLRSLDIEAEPFNEKGVGTFDLLTNDEELGAMANDQFPRWVLEWINRLLKKNGGKISLKLDWFAGKNLTALEKRVIRLQAGIDYPAEHRPSDHHPVLLKFHLNP